MRQRCSGVNFRLARRGLEGLVGQIPDFAALRAWMGQVFTEVKRWWVFQTHLTSAFSHYFCSSVVLSLTISAVFSCRPATPGDVFLGAFTSQFLATNPVLGQYRDFLRSHAGHVRFTEAGACVSFAVVQQGLGQHSKAFFPFLTRRNVRKKQIPARRAVDHMALPSLKKV